MSAPASPTGNAQHPTLAHMSGIQKRILSGFLSYELDLATQFSAGTLRNYQPRGNAECPLHRGSNIKVNQNCLNVSDPDLQGRGQTQNEPAIAADPNHPDHLVASANDYVRGDGTCGSYWSSDGGRTWNDSTLPKSPYVGVQFAAIPEFQAIGIAVGQQMSAALAGKTSVEQALKTSQTAADREMKKAGYYK